MSLPKSICKNNLGMHIWLCLFDSGWPILSFVLMAYVMAMTRKITCVEVMQRGVKSFLLTYIPGKFVVFLAGGEENKKNETVTPGHLWWKEKLGFHLWKWHKEELK